MRLSIFYTQLGQTAAGLLASLAKLGNASAFLEALVQGPLARPAFVGAWPQRPFEPVHPKWPVAPLSLQESNCQVVLAKALDIRGNTQPIPLVSAEPLGPKDQRQGPHKTQPPAHQRFSSGPSFPKHSDQPWPIIRDITYACKVIFLSFIGVSLAFSLLFGRPLSLVEAIHQGFKCGWSSEVENPWTCDK